MKHFVKKYICESNFIIRLHKKRKVGNCPYANGQNCIYINQHLYLLKLQIFRRCAAIYFTNKIIIIFFILELLEFFLSIIQS